MCINLLPGIHTYINQTQTNTIFPDYYYHNITLHNMRTLQLNEHWFLSCIDNLEYVGILLTLNFV